MEQPSLTHIPAASDRPQRAWAIAIILCLGILAYWNSQYGVFVFDDLSSLLPYKGTTPAGLASSLHLGHGETIAGRPLLAASFALNRVISGVDVWSYHAMNLAIHLAAALTLFGLVRRTLVSPKMRDQFGRDSTILAGFIAGIWMLHPLQTEAVTYIVQRAESLVSLFYLLTLYFFVRAWGGRSRIWPALAVVASVCGMLTKEVAVTVPFMALLFDRIFSGHSLREIFRRRGYLHLALFGTIAVEGALFATMGFKRGTTAGFSAGIPEIAYLRTELFALTQYLRLTVIPYPLVITRDQHWVVSASEVVIGLFVTGWILGTAIWLGLVRKRPAGFLAIWVLGVLAPTLLVPVVWQSWADHRLYLALAAPVSLIVLWLYRGIIGERTLQPGTSAGSARLAAFYGVGMAVIAVFAVMTSARNADYADPLLLWGNAVKYDPACTLSRCNYASILLDKGRVGEAVTQYVAVVPSPMSPDAAPYNLAACYAMQGRVKESMALVKVAQDRHREIPLEWVMGNGSFVTLETGDVVAAERGFQKALKAAPGDPMAHYGLGLCAIAEGRGALATSELRRAAELLPSDWLSRYTFGWELLWQRNAHEAEKQFRALVKIKPESPDGYMGLGYALAQQGKPALAGVEFRKVLSLWPECQQAQAGLAATEKAVGRNFDKSDG